MIYTILGILAAAMLGMIIYILCSPMPVVRILRRGMDGGGAMPGGWQESAGEVEIHKDLRYSSQFARSNYDLYLPKGAGKHPLVLWIHGGAFVAGDKSGVENWGIMLAAKGYAVAAINYCWAPEASYPAQIIQAGEALAEVAASEFAGRIDMERVVAAGDSAGAFMALQFALAHTNSRLSEELGMKSPIDKSALKGVLLYCGPYDIKKVFDIKDRKLRFFVSRIGWSFFGKKDWKTAPLIESAMPLGYITEDFVPCYITDGNTGSFEKHGMDLGKRLREMEIEVKERYFPLAKYGEVPHEYQMQLNTENGAACFQDTLEFLSAYI